jgi:hypothetical protein
MGAGILTRGRTWCSGRLCLALALAVVFGATLVSGASASSLQAGPLVRVSGSSPFSPGCELVPQTGTNYLNAEVEPRVAVDPSDPHHLVGAFQQDRWSSGGSRGLVAAVSRDGGQTWTSSFAHFSFCSGGTAANGGGFERASDPWVTIAPDGTAYQIALVFDDDTSSSDHAVLVSRSADGGDSWGEPTALVREQPRSLATFHDKESISADPSDANAVYAVWDRGAFTNDHANPDAPLNTESAVRSDVRFSRTTDGGGHWEPARVIWAPTASKSEISIGNQIAVLPNHHLVDVMLHLKNARGTQRSSPDISVLRSTDRGLTWSKRILVGAGQFVPVTDPDTGQEVRTSANIPDIAADPGSGRLYAVWEDAQFSVPPYGHAYTGGIAFSQSSDEGRTWSPPVQISQTPHAQAFTPSIAVTAGGTVGVTYYDFRNNTPSPGLPTDYWLVHCHADCANSTQWSETHVAGPFDMETAPTALGLFVGDYEGLAGVGNSLLPFFVQANSGNLANRTDVFATTVSPQP